MTIPETKPETTPETLPATTPEATPEVISINLPASVDETTWTLIGSKIVFVTIEFDHDCENPLTSCDGFGAIHSLNSRHTNYMEFDAMAEIVASDPDAVPLSHYEHSHSF